MEIEIQVKEKVMVKSCPNPRCESLKVDLELDTHSNEFHIVCAQCGMAGPFSVKQQFSVDFWNVLLRRSND